MGNTMSGVLEIAMALIGVAILALLVGHASGTSQVIQSATGGFNDLLRTVTLQNGMTTYQ
jgi:hypothetical protein